MSELSPEPEREPSNADLLAAIEALAAQQQAISQLAADDLAEVRAEMRRGFMEVRHDIGQLRADTLAAKADGAYVAAYIGDLQDAHRRHRDDPDAHSHAA